MPTVIIRPDGDSAVGNFSNTPIHAVLSDSNDATFTNNTTTNQTFIVTFDDVSLSGATFNSFALTVRAKKGGKGNATMNVRLADSSTVLSFASLSVTSSSFTDFSAGAASFSSGYSDSDVNGINVRIDTTNNTQAFISEIFLTIDYTAAVSGYGHDVNSVGSSSIGKINSVATASIGKVNSVD